MKIIATDNYQSTFDLFIIVIDKSRKEVFAMKNFSCMADASARIQELFCVNNIDVHTRFSLISSGTSIDQNLIPKKYKKFTILK